MGRFQWPHGLRRRSTPARLLRSGARIPSGAWMFFGCVLSGRGLCDELITRPDESYRLWRVVVCEITKPRERGGHSLRWAAELEKTKKVMSMVSHNFKAANLEEPCKIDLRFLKLAFSGVTCRNTCSSYRADTVAY
jgi:hypothetical protein